jgi:hypothetical protein
MDQSDIDLVNYHQIVKLSKTVLWALFQSQTYHGAHVTWHQLLQLEEVDLLHKQFTAKVLMLPLVKLYQRSPMFLHRNNVTSSAVLVKLKRNKIVEVEQKL